MDYNKILCESIDTIVSQRLKDISFDSTVIGTIIDDTNSLEGIYQVEIEGKVKIEAYSEILTYKNGTQVQVLIPGNDMSNQQKTITGRYIPKKEKTTTAYVNPFESYVKMSTGFAEESLSKEHALIANSDIEFTLIGSYYTQEKDNSLLYTTLGLTASFKCPLAEKKITAGEYGIELRLFQKKDNEWQEIFANNGISAEKKERLRLSSKMMFGNPYSYNSYFKQEVMISLLKVANSIDKIDFYLYQKKDFIENDAPFGVAENPNIFVKDLTVSYGNDVRLVENRTFKIYCSQLNFTKEDNQRTIKSVWYNKSATNKYLGYNDTTKYSIQWQYLDNGIWKDYDFQQTEKEPFPYFQIVDIDLLTQVKHPTVRAVLNREDILYYSQPLQFNNISIADDQGAKAAALELVPGAHSYYTYLYEKGSGRLITPDKANQKVINILYYPLETGISKSQFFLNSSVLWKIPAKNSMLKPDMSYYQEKGSVVLQDDFYYIQDKKEIPDKEHLYYNIANIFSTNSKDNAIECQITYTDKNSESQFVYGAKMKIIFEPKDGTETDYTLVIQTDENQDLDHLMGLSDTKGNIKQLKLVAKLYAPDGISMAIPASRFHWKWRKNQPLNLNPDNTVTVPPTVENKNTFLNNYNVLEVSVDIFQKEIETIDANGDPEVTPTTLRKEIAIPFSEDIEYKCGVSEYITYAGTHAQYSKDLHIYKNGDRIDMYGAGQSKKTLIWKVIYHGVSSKGKEKLPKIIQDNAHNYALIAPSIHFKEIEGNISLQAQLASGESSSGPIVWQQPMIINESIYGAPIFEDWVDKITIGDDQVNAMISVGDGASDSFSTIFIGKKQNINQQKKARALGQPLKEDQGVFGYHDDKQFLGIDTNGLITIGDGDYGQMRIGAGQGVLESVDKTLSLDLINNTLATNNLMFKNKHLVLKPLKIDNKIYNILVVEE